MNIEERHKIFRQIMWDYNISSNISSTDVEEVLKEIRDTIGHYDKQAIFIKLLESFSWFTIVQLFSHGELRQLLSDDVVKKLIFKSLRTKYTFVQKDYNNLYLLQDKFLTWWVPFGLPFYLTGGTALGRFYFNHRFSEDLDFFVNNDPGFSNHILFIKNELQKQLTGWRCLNMPKRKP